MNGYYHTLTTINHTKRRAATKSPSRRPNVREMPPGGADPGYHDQRFRHQSYWGDQGPPARGWGFVKISWG